MSTNSNKKIEDQEIDLALISEKIGIFFQKINTSIFKTLQFLIKKSKIILIIIIISVGLGLYFDKAYKTFDHQIIVEPNFKSTDYLYSKINLIESKIKEGDFVFLKQIGIKDPNYLLKISVNPIVDLNKFINTASENNQSFELLKLMVENGDIKKIVEDKVMSKSYSHYLITISTTNKNHVKETVEPILNFLNKSSFYSRVQKQEINNIESKIKANDDIIAQIDGFLNNFTKKTDSSQNIKSDKLVYYNENTQLNDAIETKNKLISEKGYLRLQLVSADKIIKDNSTTLNIENTKSINGKLKFILPFLFIFIFILIHFFISFYKKQAEKANQN
ncbi:hypothetical protein [Flavobacterium myungsuense]|jgi:hypothetical protein|uniref:Polysaccharide chain length determinant N-terminal domain-containing protein n=1 Tax=Flavobacterium myungsuense TaxID=651823 RepID=A0ABW3J408_9FLAO